MRGGMRGMSPKQQKMLMRRAGINFESVEDVREVIVRTGGADYVFVRPDVSIMVMQGQKTWQITGEPEKRPAGSAGQAVPGGTTPPEGDASPEISGEEESSAAPSIPAEDVALVAQQTGVSEEEARKALVECDGNPAEAIIRLMR